MGWEGWGSQGYIGHGMACYSICFIPPIEYITHNKDKKNHDYLNNLNF